MSRREDFSFTLGRIGQNSDNPNGQSHARSSSGLLLNLAPAALAAGPSIGEQTFTVNGLDVGDYVVFAGLLTATGAAQAQTANVAIVGCRVSATNTLAITFLTTTGTPTPVNAKYQFLLFKQN